jgi:hypothetical protein
MNGPFSKAMLRKTWRFIAGKSVKLLLMDFLASNAADHKMVFHTVWGTGQSCGTIPSKSMLIK